MLPLLEARDPFNAHRRPLSLSVAHAADQFDNKPAIAESGGVVDQQPRRAIQYVDYDIDVAIVVDVACGDPASGKGSLEYCAASGRDVHKLPFHIPQGMEVPFPDNPRKR